VPFVLDRLPEYSDASLIAEIRRVASIVRQPRLSTSEFAKHSKVAVTTLRRRFGSWPAALEAAGLFHLYRPIPPTRKSRTAARNMGDDELLTELRRVADVTGRSTITAEDLRRQSLVGVDAIRRRFSSLKAALRAAGLTEVPHGRRYTDDECFENLLHVWTHYGRPPQHREMSLPPSQVGPKAYTCRWGTWNKGLHAFVERVNADVEVEMSPAPLLAASPASSTTPALSESERRDVRLGLRYAILKRDRFRCVLCGASPATSPDCRLHVDHIVPFSKGGRTELANLRTLCEPCNLGKGAHIEGVAEQRGALAAQKDARQ
jgi:hypothetical protein